jgi:hypothetical protein
VKPLARLNTGNGNSFDVCGATGAIDIGLTDEDCCAGGGGDETDEPDATIGWSRRVIIACFTASLSFLMSASRVNVFNRLLNTISVGILFINAIF